MRVRELGLKHCALPPPQPLSVVRLGFGDWARLRERGRN